MATTEHNKIIHSMVDVGKSPTASCQESDMAEGRTTLSAFRVFVMTRMSPKGSNTMPLSFLTLAVALGLLSQSVALGATANSGKEMYVQYCSSCHGRVGRGDGKVSEFLKLKVPDLTILRKNNKGVYPADLVILAIDGRRTIRGHGEPKMPVWGEAFSREAKDPKTAEVATLQREKMIADYVATLQR
jgi:mono/diheme cytochrome c family protein